MTRLLPLPEEEWDDRTRQALSSFLPRWRRNEKHAGNALATMVRHPELTEAYLPFGAQLLFRSTLPPRLLELVILRIAHRTGCEYEWNHHVVSAAKAGLTEEEIAAAGRGEAEVALDRIVLTAVDELADTFTLSASTRDLLDQHLDERQRLDLVVTVGGYRMLALAFNSFGIEPDGDAEE